ncbi:hypothetical protein ANN_23140 [Periplaneta americana]|uniref:Uncharacterized protein n=1 Tax=Periplaneta americana TaxID=6978 RepID=A0ABQ8SK94_PERAM|nr:hypothetical protein ANN_23140 [Periplaneta americana]
MVKKLALKGELNNLRNTKGEKDYWVCERKPEYTATATRSIRNVTEELKEGQHALAPKVEKVQAWIIVNRMKRTEGEHPEITPSQLLRNELHGAPSEMLNHIPRKRDFKNKY